MNKRKLFGTILGLIFWSFCVVFFTYAYYDWKSDNTNVVLGIQDLSVECLVGTNVEATNIGPVLNYQGGVKAEFSINNILSESMAIELYLDITSISDNLLTESFKYALIADSTGGTNYDYSNPIIEGDFTSFNIGNNLITQDLEVTPSTTTNYQFIIYIDGNMKNDPNMQQNSLIGNILIGNCGEDATPLNSIVYQAIYSETDNFLTFVHTKQLTVGDTYNNKIITTLYTGFDTAKYTSQNSVPWYKDGNYQNITSVTFEEIVSPQSTAYWFKGFSKLSNIDLEKLDTNMATNMAQMFTNCSSLISLDLSNFDTINVTDMYGMFYGCRSLVNLDISSFDTSKIELFENMFNECTSLIELDLSNFDASSATDLQAMFANCSSLTKIDLSNFDTSNVTNMSSMFYKCNKITSLNLSKFDTSNVSNMKNMFNGCSSLISLDLSNFDTSNVTNMSSMFYDCNKLTSLDLSNFDTSNVETISEMFRGCVKLINLNINNFDTTNVTNMYYTFQLCSNLSLNITISNLEITNYSNVFYMAATTSGAQITVNYTSETSVLVESMIATKANHSNVVKGICVDCEEASSE